MQVGYDLIITNFANGDVIGHTSNNAAKVECAQWWMKRLAKFYLLLHLLVMIPSFWLIMATLEWMITEDGSATCRPYYQPGAIYLPSCGWQGNGSPTGWNSGRCCPRLYCISSVLNNLPKWMERIYSRHGSPGNAQKSISNYFGWLGIWTR